MTAGRRISFALLAIGALLALPAAANATVRFAAAGGTATAAQCTTPANPCTIFEAAQGTGVTGADEVVIAPGNYSDSAGDLGPSGFVQPVAGDVHGDVGKPRPVITLNQAGGLSGAFFISGTTLSDVEIDTAVNRANYVLFSGLVERVVARSSSTVAQTIACTHDGGTIRDSVCLTSGSDAAAIGASLAGGVGTMNLTLRNLTAVSTGTNSFGASYRFFGGTAANWNINALSVIARGTSKDVVAGALLNSGTCPNTTVSLDFSDYATTQTQTDACGGTATVTTAGSLANQTTAPMLDADGFHQLAGSITVDHGFTDGSSGGSDIDGQLRTIGSAADIGADELTHQTSTVVACTPAALTLGAATTCTATVTDDSAGPTTPIGKVDFSSSGVDSIAGTPCALATVSASQASCQVTITPSQVGSGTDQITGAYPGDVSHDSSQGSFPLGVSAPVTQGGGSVTTSTVNPLCATLRKKLRKAKTAHNAPKVRKLRRKLRRLGC